MRPDAITTLNRLRRWEERAARLELVRASAAAAAEAALGDPPHDVMSASASVDQFLSARAKAHITWAVWGERMSRVEEAEARRMAAQASWAKAASDMKAVERLASRRSKKAKAEEALAAQRDLDEAAIGQWNRKHVDGAAGRP